MLCYFRSGKGLDYGLSPSLKTLTKRKFPGVRSLESYTVVTIQFSSVEFIPKPNFHTISLVFSDDVVEQGMRKNRF